MNKLLPLIIVAYAALTLTLLTGCPAPGGEGSPSPSPSPTPAPVVLNKIELYLRTPNTMGTTGNVILQVRDESGATTLAQTSIAAATTYDFTWRQFDFSPSLNLNRGTMYRMYVQRTAAHNTLSDSIGWGAYHNVYPAGDSSTPGDDFIFRTYDGANVDQEEGGSGAISIYPYLNNSSWLWQEFVPGN